MLHELCTMEDTNGLKPGTDFPCAVRLGRGRRDARRAEGMCVKINTGEDSP